MENILIKNANIVDSAHILVHVGHGGKDIFKRCFPAVLGVDRNNVFFLNGGC